MVCIRLEAPAETWCRRSMTTRPSTASSCRTIRRVEASARGSSRSASAAARPSIRISRASARDCGLLERADQFPRAAINPCPRSSSGADMKLIAEQNRSAAPGYPPAQASMICLPDKNRALLAISSIRDLVRKQIGAPFTILSLRPGAVPDQIRQWTPFCVACITSRDAGASVLPPPQRSDYAAFGPG